MTKFGGLAVVSVACCVLGACLPSDPGPRGEVAVSTDNGDVILRLRPCEEPAIVKTVEIKTAGSDSRTVWAIHSKDGSNLDFFKPGTTPTGFEEDTALSEKWQSGQHYAAVITLFGHTLKPVTEFDPAKLDPEHWRIDNGRSLSDKELIDLKPCG